MAFQVILHLHNEEPFAADIEVLPDPTHNFICVTNPRKRDGKALGTLTDGATAVIYPWTRVSFIEVMGTGGGAGAASATGDSMMSFFRENGNDRR